MARPIVSVLTGALLAVSIVVGFSACTVSTSSGTSCTDTSNAGPCSGTFACGNSGIQGACDKATQACLLKPGMVTCITIAGASASSCPSVEAAHAGAGCTLGGSTTCSGSPSEGITIQCE